MRLDSAVGWLAPMAPLMLVGEQFTSMFGWSFSNSWTAPIIGAAGLIAAIIGVVFCGGARTDRCQVRLASAGVLLLLPSLVGWRVSEPIASLLTMVGPALAGGVLGVLGLSVIRTRTMPWKAIGWALAAACVLWVTWTLSWGALALLPPAAVSEIVTAGIPASTALEIFVLVCVIVVTNRWVGAALLSGSRWLWRSADVR